ncbi:helix-turn-helix domain-containing protein [Steroidobacter sp.]|uniref:helix-turn-helix domain-containing protein n=1 Tax=Steroidobacter sp. TaxID=1978227 RepID=UPI001A529B19|nr:helix-turn-helix domain-containing protein [Steroidobacter sp.]MBL8269563.1 helix-turn-helix domain-containing protein [Steroidobacter sp.]
MKTTSDSLRAQCERAGLRVLLTDEVDSEVCAQILDIEERTLRGWRQQGYGPPWRPQRQRRLYALSDIAVWMDRQRQEVADRG